MLPAARAEGCGAFARNEEADGVVQDQGAVDARAASEKTRAERRDAPAAGCAGCESGRALGGGPGGASAAAASAPEEEASDPQRRRAPRSHRTPQREEKGVERGEGAPLGPLRDAAAAAGARTRAGESEDGAPADVHAGGRVFLLSLRRKVPNELVLETRAAPPDADVLVTTEGVVPRPKYRREVYSAVVQFEGCDEPVEAEDVFGTFREAKRACTTRIIEALMRECSGDDKDIHRLKNLSARTARRAPLKMREIGELFTDATNEANCAWGVVNIELLVPREMPARASHAEAAEIMHQFLLLAAASLSKWTAVEGERPDAERKSPRQLRDEHDVGSGAEWRAEALPLALGARLEIRLAWPRKDQENCVVFQQSDEAWRGAAADSGATAEEGVVTRLFFVGFQDGKVIEPERDLHCHDSLAAAVRSLVRVADEVAQRTGEAIDAGMLSAADAVLRSGRAFACEVLELHEELMRLEGAPRVVYELRLALPSNAAARATRADELRAVAHACAALWAAAASRALL